MARYLVFGRREYAEPLERLATVETDDTPTVADTGVGDDWLELAVIPEKDVMWVVREGTLIEERRGVPA